MKILFLELNGVLSNNLEEYIDSSKPYTPDHIHYFNSFIAQNDLRIIFITKYFNDMSEPKAFRLASNLGLDSSTFITKLNTEDDVITTVSNFLSTRDDIDFYYIISNHQAKIVSYNPYIYTTLGILRKKDMDVIQETFKVLEIPKEYVQNKTTKFYEQQVKESKEKEEIKKEAVNYIKEVQKLLDLDKDKYLNLKGYKLLLKHYNDKISTEELQQLFIDNGMRTRNYVYVYNIFLPSIFIGAVASLIVFAIFKVIWLLLFFFPIFFLAYTMFEEVTSDIEYLDI